MHGEAKIKSRRNAAGVKIFSNLCGENSAPLCTQYNDLLLKQLLFAFSNATITRCYQDDIKQDDIKLL